MIVTIHDLFDRLKQEEECNLLDMLGLTSEDIVEKFQDEIEDQFEELRQNYQEEYGDFLWETEEEDSYL